MLLQPRWDLSGRRDKPGEQSRYEPEQSRCSCPRQCVQIISADLIFCGVDKVCFSTTHAKNTLGSHRNSWVAAKGNILQWVLCSLPLTSPPCPAVHRNSPKEGSGVLLLFSMCIRIKSSRKGTTKPWTNQGSRAPLAPPVLCWQLFCYHFLLAPTLSFSSCFFSNIPCLFFSPPLALLLLNIHLRWGFFSMPFLCNLSHMCIWLFP